MNRTKNNLKFGNVIASKAVLVFRGVFAFLYRRYVCFSSFLMTSTEITDFGNHSTGWLDASELWPLG